MKLQLTRDGVFELVGYPTPAEKELGARKLAEMLVPGSKAANFLGFDGNVEKFVLKGQYSEGGSNAE